jgi:hypothetical protein
MCQRVKEFIELVHHECKSGREDLEQYLLGHSFKVPALGIKIEDFDEISGQNFRHFLPFILKAVGEYPREFEENYKLRRFLARPYSEFLHRNCKQISMLQELKQRSNPLTSWMSPTLTAFSLSELVCAREVVRCILESSDENHPFATELFDLNQALEMAIIYTST